MGLNERQIQAVLYVKKHRSITNQEYQRLLKVSKRTASTELTELAQKGILIKTGGARGQGVAYRARNG
ncbi:MAG: hypothetical protein KatS3mg016_0829 [Fimbriimonadales bacterium]|nr:MAG: hypothetical protein KatS3mg016_0829 [Fimbriimonadales bacterium]